mgnify:CR=1 FL=1
MKSLFLLLFYFNVSPEVPEGGLASFLTATVGDWSDEALNADNYYDIVKPTAEQLAQFGREEDDRIAHVATGETIIPMAVFEKDLALKEAVFNRMMEMGIDRLHPEPRMGFPTVWDH